MQNSLLTIGNNLPPIASGFSGSILTGLQILTACSSFSCEANPKTRAQYSKFAQLEHATDRMIGSRDGMILIYLPAFLVTTSMYLLSTMTSLSFFPEQSLAEIFLIIHYGKRLLEVLFLHKYSGKVGRNLSIGIGIYYALVSLLISCISFPAKNAGRNIITIGTTLFSIGVAGNLYHHYILAELRDPSRKESSKYVPPQGGLFEYVAAPHYLFELIGWLGIAIVSQHLNSYLVFLCMTSYLSGRAYAQNKWNQDKLSEKEWGRTRKNILPFIF